MPEERTLTITVSVDQSVTALATDAYGDNGWTFIYAPGASSNVDEPFGRYMCMSLAEQGIACVRFQFPFQEARKKIPDGAPLLQQTWTAVIEHLRPAKGRLVVGGRSMGGHIASQAVAQDWSVDALALFAYPLHPPGNPEQRRDQHLSALQLPTLFCSGTNDAFGSPEELREAAAIVPKATVYVLEHADHEFNVHKSSNRTRQEAWAEAVAAMRHWLPRV